MADLSQAAAQQREMDPMPDASWYKDLEHGVSVGTGTKRVMLNLAYDSPCFVFQDFTPEEADALADALRSAADIVRRRVT